MMKPMPKPTEDDLAIQAQAEMEMMADAENEAMFYEGEGDAENEELIAKEKMLAALKGHVSKLEGEVKRRIDLRVSQEEIWLEDIRQLHGHYDPEVLSKLQQEEKSQLFINVTRPKTNTGSAKIYDMLFPTDDRNWGIAPTPVPELAADIENGDAEAQQITERANQMVAAGDEQGAEALVQGAQGPAGRAIAARKTMELAERKSRGMELEIDDQFRECGYNIQSRDAIDDGCTIGTGIMKGPVLPIKPTGRWTSVMDDASGKSVQVWDTTARPKPCYFRTDPWHFFPDPDASDIRHGNGTFERHPMNESRLRKLAQVDGFDREAISRLLKTKALSETPNFYNALRSITGSSQETAGEMYHVWEHYGVVTAEELRQIAAAMGNDDMASDYPEDDDDNITEIPVCVWFCQGEILKFVEHPLDSGDGIYSVWCWQKDPSSIFGYGIPRVMRDSQKALNAAWRMMMDNAGLSTGPQIFMAKGSIEPADGVWDLKPRKFWYITRAIMPGEKVVETVDIQSHQAELMAIIDLVRKVIDDETGITALTQGEQGTGITKTAQGMAILMNSTNVVFRRVIKNWDDDMTTPNVQRAYHFNMQFSDKEEIKGDYEVHARGSSVLMVREMQAQSLMTLLMNASAHPVLGPLTKIPDLYRKAVQANQIPSDEVVLTEDEVAEMEAERQNQPPPPDLEMMKLEVQERIATATNEMKLMVAELDHQRAMMELAEKRNMSVEQIQADLEKTNMTTQSSERKLAVEVAMREATGQSAGGSV